MSRRAWATAATRGGSRREAVLEALGHPVRAAARRGPSRWPRRRRRWRRRGRRPGCAGRRPSRRGSAGPGGARPCGRPRRGCGPARRRRGRSRWCARTWVKGRSRGSVAGSPARPSTRRSRTGRAQRGPDGSRGGPWARRTTSRPGPRAVGGWAGDDDPVHPVLGRLRPRRQLGRRLPAPAARRRGVAGPHRALLQPHRLRPVARPADAARGRPRGRHRHRGARRAAARSTPSSPATRAASRSARSSSTPSRAPRPPTPKAIYACDPVMGNATSGCFVHPAIPVLLREKVVPEGRPHHPEPVRARLPHRDRAGRPRLHPRLRRAGPGHGPLDRPRHERAAARPPRGHHRDARRPRRRRLDRPDPAPAAEGQRLRRRHRRPVHRPPARDQDAGVALGRTVSSVFDLLRAPTSPGVASSSSSRARRRSPTRGCSSRSSASTDRRHLRAKTPGRPTKEVGRTGAFRDPARRRAGVRGRRGRRGG